MAQQQVGSGDLGYWFRTQEVRTIEDVDTLHAHCHKLKMDLGPEHSKEIEDCPELFADADKYRILHAKARMRTAILLGATFVAGTSYGAQLQGMKSGMHFFKRYSLPITLGMVGYSVFLYNVNHYVAGYRSDSWKEYNYAKCLRQLRNVQVK